MTDPAKVNPSASEKAILRKSMLSIRRAMPVDEWQHKSHQLCAQLAACPLFIDARTVLAYLSFRQEPDLSSLFTLDKIWGFSRCVGQDLLWHQWSPESSLPLQKGAFGVLEPHPDAPAIAPDTVDLILVPAVACDVQGFRLGYGAGFYDRLFSSPVWANQAKIGIVFDAARLSELPHDPWDQPVQAVCTESGVFWVEPNP